MYPTLSQINFLLFWKTAKAITLACSKRNCVCHHFCTQEAHWPFPLCLLLKMADYTCDWLNNRFCYSFYSHCVYIFIFCWSFISKVLFFTLFLFVIFVNNLQRTDWQLLLQKLWKCSFELLFLITLFIIPHVAFRYALLLFCFLFVPVWLLLAL